MLVFRKLQREKLKAESEAILDSIDLREFDADTLGIKKGDLNDDEEEDEEDFDELYCVACKKKFKSEKQFV